MKKFVFVLFAMFIGAFAYAETISLSFMNEDDTVYENATCTLSGDLIIPNTNPTKRGYTFAGWRNANVQRIEYLESTGSQYIDTGFAYDSSVSNMPFKMDFTVGFLENLTCNNCYFPFSGYSFDGSFSSATLLALYFRYNSLGLIVEHGNNSTYVGSKATSTGAPENYIYEIDPVNKTQTIYNNSRSETQKTNNPISSSNLWLFRANNYSGTTKPIRIYRWSFESNGVKIRDFIPVIKDGTPCLYDLVEHKFYYNAGTGNFIAGPVLNE